MKAELTEEVTSRASCCPLLNSRRAVLVTGAREAGMRRDIDNDKDSSLFFAQGGCHWEADPIEVQ